MNDKPAVSNPESPHESKPENSEKHTVVAVLEALITDIESIRSSATVSGLFMTALGGVVIKRYHEFLETCEKVAESPGAYRVPIEQFGRHRKLKEEGRMGRRSLEILPRSFIVSLISQYDAFLSALIKALIGLKPALLKSSNRTLDLSELLTFASIEEAKDSFLEAEIETLLRDSHHQQFEWMEKKFEIRTLRDFPAWSQFVEVTQRRNLFVHSDGRVSKQYLSVCKANNVQVAELKPGDQMQADGSYVRKSADMLYEVGVKLTQVLWRKIRPDESPIADLSILNVTYELILKGRYSLAINLLDFAFEVIKRFEDPDIRLRLLINRANAYRLSGNDAKCIDLLSQERWEAYDPSFRLGAHLLKGETQEAYKCMRLIGPNGSVTKSDYREWPLFERFRDDAGFRGMFVEVFGEELSEKVLRSEAFDLEEKSHTEFSFDMFLRDEPVLPPEKKAAVIN